MFAFLANFLIMNIVVLLKQLLYFQHRVTCKDWVGIFPNDCSFQNTVDFDRMVSYEFVLHRPVSTKELRYKMKISLEGAQNLNFDEEYVFVYFNSNSEVSLRNLELKMVIQ